MVNEQEWRGRAHFTECPAQASQRVAQIAEGIAFRAIWPQHSRQRGSALRSRCLHGKIGEKRPGLVRFEPCQRLTIQLDLESAQKRQDEARHMQLQSQGQRERAFIIVIRLSIKDNPRPRFRHAAMFQYPLGTHFR